MKISMQKDRNKNRDNSTNKFAILLFPASFYFCFFIFLYYISCFGYAFIYKKGKLRICMLSYIEIILKQVYSSKNINIDAATMIL